MSLAQRFERRLESLVGSAFARVFKGQVEPVEIGSALQREAGDKRNVMGNGEVLAPNRYRVTLAPSDHDRLSPWEMQLTNSLAELVQEHLDQNSWRTIGDIEVYLARDESLHTGVFGVASRMESTAPPRRRPYDSLSLPAVVGEPPGQYAAPYGASVPEQAAPGFSGTPHPAPQAPSVPSSVIAAAGQFAPGPHAPGRFVPGQIIPGRPTPYHSQSPYDAPQPQPSYPPSHPPSGQARSRAALVVDGTNRRVELRMGSNIVGRGSEADLQLLDQGVSRRHLDIQFDGNFATAYDLGSTNGTNVNGHDVGSQLLRHGDVIRVGHTRVVFQQEQM
ncbi:MAG: FhaA domain-containing protein [Actinomycetota bacterium]